MKLHWALIVLYEVGVVSDWGLPSCLRTCSSFPVLMLCWHMEYQQQHTHAVTLSIWFWSPHAFWQMQQLTCPGSWATSQSDSGPSLMLSKHEKSIWQRRGGGKRQMKNLEDSLRPRRNLHAQQQMSTTRGKKCERSRKQKIKVAVVICPFRSKGQIVSSLHTLHYCHKLFHITQMTLWLPAQINLYQPTLNKTDCESR